jgi:hypothetical protein
MADLAKAQVARRKQIIWIVASMLSLTVSLALVAKGALAAVLDHRPANLFTAIWEKDKQICGPVLASLNKEHRLSQDLYNVVQNPNFITDLLLTSDLQVQWQRMPLKSGDQLDYVSVDLANSGRPISVFRWDFSDALGFRNQLMLPPAVPDEVASGQPLPNDIISRLGGPNAQNVLKITVPMSSFWTAETFPSNGLFDFNLLEVAKKVFLLGAGSQDAQRTVMQGGGFNAFVMEFHSMHEVSVICHFRGEKQR